MLSKGEGPVSNAEDGAELEYDLFRLNRRCGADPACTTKRSWVPGLRRGTSCRSAPGTRGATALLNLKSRRSRERPAAFRQILKAAETGRSKRPRMSSSVALCTMPSISPGFLPDVLDLFL